MMAPRLIARSIASPRQVERAGPSSREHGPEADCDLARTPNPVRTSDYREFLSLFKG